MKNKKDNKIQNSMNSSSDLKNESVLEYRIGTQFVPYDGRLFFFIEAWVRGGKVVGFGKISPLWDVPTIDKLATEFNNMRGAFFKPIIDVNDLSEYEPEIGKDIDQFRHLLDKSKK